MTYLATGPLYYSLREYWYLHNPVEDTTYAQRFRHWLQEQGCEIVPRGEHGQLLVDIMEVSPGYDQFYFQDDLMATLFVLRWS